MEEIVFRIYEAGQFTYLYHMSEGRVILSGERLSITINRICHELIETFHNWNECCIIGIQPRGVDFANRIVKHLQSLGVNDFEYGKLDITFLQR